MGRRQATLVEQPTHVIIDAVVHHTGDSPLLRKFVELVAKKVGLNIVERDDGSKVIDSLPFYKTEGTFGDGCSCLALLIESNIAVHTRDAERIVNLDVFSCRNFSWTEIIKLMDKFFGIEKVTRIDILQR